jgi:hypothetical protein
VEGRPGVDGKPASGRFNLNLRGKPMKKSEWKIVRYGRSKWMIRRRVPIAASNKLNQFVADTKKGLWAWVANSPHA